jgi:hypothetical protein
LSVTAMTLQTLWASTCSAVFIVKTMKRVIFSEARQHQHGFESVGAVELRAPRARVRAGAHALGAGEDRVVVFVWWAVGAMRLLRFA